MPRHKALSPRALLNRSVVLNSDDTSVLHVHCSPAIGSVHWQEGDIPNRRRYRTAVTNHTVPLVLLLFPVLRRFLLVLQRRRTGCPCSPFGPLPATPTARANPLHSEPSDSTPGRVEVQVSNYKGNAIHPPPGRDCSNDCSGDRCRPALEPATTTPDSRWYPRQPLVPQTAVGTPDSRWAIFPPRKMALSPNGQSLASKLAPQGCDPLTGNLARPVAPLKKRLFIPVSEHPHPGASQAFPISNC
jgi:hypothetical protein